MLGVFDSGVGGLTVVKELRRLMPNTSITYVGDTARAPYGGKDAQTLFNHGCEIISFLRKKGATIIVMACGTSSSVSLEPLQAKFPDLPIVDTIRPAVKATLELAKTTEDFRPVFIATEATIKSGVFARLCNEGIASGYAVPQVPCPLFAPMVEAGLAADENSPLLNFAAEAYLSPLRGKVNALILGCTHYPLITNALTHTLGEITFINPATATAEATQLLLPPTTHNPTTHYFASGDPDNFAKMARLILGEDCNTEKISF